MRAELLFEHVQGICGYVHVALRQIEVNAAQFLAQQLLMTRVGRV